MSLNICSPLLLSLCNRIFSEHMVTQLKDTFLPLKLGITTGPKMLKWCVQIVGHTFKVKEGICPFLFSPFAIAWSVNVIAGRGAVILYHQFGALEQLVRRGHCSYWLLSHPISLKITKKVFLLEKNKILSPVGQCYFSLNLCFTIESSL